VNRLLVGAYGYGAALAYFSDFGACVDVYAPGVDVVAPLPGDWVFPLSGTSFSAPLVVRLLSTAGPVPFDPASARRALIALRQPNGNLQPGNFPPDLLYDPGGNYRSGALTQVVAGDAGVTASPSAPFPPPQTARIDPAALRRLLWPVRWIERHRRP
jgi:subtilisin family serine protease